MNKAKVEKMITKGRRFLTTALMEQLPEDDRREAQKIWDHLTGEWRMTFRALGMSDEEVRMCVAVIAITHVALSRKTEEVLDQMMEGREGPPTPLELHKASAYYVGGLQDNVGALIQLAGDLAEQAEEETA